VSKEEIKLGRKNDHTMINVRGMINKLKVNNAKNQFFSLGKSPTLVNLSSEYERNGMVVIIDNKNTIDHCISIQSYGP
jgi:hypothetical protein